MLFLRRSLILPVFCFLCLIYYTLYRIPTPSGRSPAEYAETVNLNDDTASSTTTQTDNRIHWQKRPEKYPVKSYIPLPAGNPVAIPKIQYDFPRERSSDRSRRQERQTAVLRAFQHAWKGYKDHAWLKDEVKPLSGGYTNSFGGWAATLVDSLDSLWIMGLKEEFESALAALDQIDFTTTEDKDINVFETTIRYLGGFLGAYDLSEGKYPILLQKATEVAEMLYTAFDTHNRMQVSRWEWRKSVQGETLRPSPNTLLAEVGSLSLEFTRLTQLTGDPKYYDAIQRVSDVLEKAQPTTRIPGLWPMMVDLDHLHFNDVRFTIGGMADSTYEYLPKEHLLLGGRTKQYQKMYEAAMKPINEKIFYRPMTKNGEDILFPGGLQATGGSSGKLQAEAQHLTCFMGGVVGIGAKIFNRPEELAVARKLTDACIWAYDVMPTGLMPEVFATVACEDRNYCPWDEDLWVSELRSHTHYYGNAKNESPEQAEAIKKDLIQKAGLPPGMSGVSDARYILRPEAIESVFILYRITGDKELQDAAWRMFQSIEKLARTEYAHAGIYDVRTLDTEKMDKMESFWLAETLKYFYLIFSEPSLVSLDEYVFNTEAHPLKRPTT